MSTLENQGDTRPNGPVSPSSLLVARADVVACDFGDGSALLDLLSGTYFGLNTTAAFVWDCLQTPSTPADIAARVAESFDVDQQTCSADVGVLLQKLADAKLVDVSAG